MFYYIWLNLSWLVLFIENIPGPATGVYICNYDQKKEEKQALQGIHDLYRTEVQSARR